MLDQQTLASLPLTQRIERRIIALLEISQSVLLTVSSTPSPPHPNRRVSSTSVFIVRYFEHRHTPTVFFVVLREAGLLALCCSKKIRPSTKKSILVIGAATVETEKAYGCCTSNALRLYFSLSGGDDDLTGLSSI